MFVHARAPWRPHPVPVAGTFVSLTVHAVAVAAVVATGGSAGGAAEVATGGAGAPFAHGGEQLHWVGIGPTAGTPVHVVRPGERPPAAYVIPGRGETRRVVGGAAGDARVAEERARSARVPAAGPADRATSEPAHREARRRPAVKTLRLPLLPDLALPELEATLLVAGVVSVAPDFSRSVASAEDFAPALDSISQRAGPAVWTTALQRLDELHVDELPIPVVSNPPPIYPQALQQAHVGGQVVVEFLIDSTGVIDLASLRVVESSDNLFTQAVRRVLPRMRFLPAQLGPRTVGVTVRQPFVFVIRPGR